MTINELTMRDQLIVRILHMPDEQIAQLANLIESIENDPNWGDEGISAEELARRNVVDLVTIDATAGEPTTSLEDVMRELNIQL